MPSFGTCDKCRKSERRHALRGDWAPGAAPKRRAILYEHLGRFLEAGFGLDRALEALPLREAAALRKAVGTDAGDGAGGATLTDAIAAAVRPPRHEVALLATAEKTGQLATQLFELAGDIDQEIQAFRKAAVRLIYPILLWVSSVVLLNVPVFVFGGASAYLKRVAVGLAWIGAVVGVGYFLIAVAPRIPKVRGWMNRIAATSVVARLWRGLGLDLGQRARFVRALGQCLNAGLAPTRALDLAGEAAGNARWHSAMNDAAARIGGGAGLTESLTGRGVLTQDSLDWISTAEKTGTLSDSLRRHADVLREAWHRRLAAAARMAGVTLSVFVLVVMGYSLLNQAQRSLQGPTELLETLGGDFDSMPNPEDVTDLIETLESMGEYKTEVDEAMPYERR